MCTCVCVCVREREREREKERDDSTEYFTPACTLTEGLNVQRVQTS